MARRRRNINLGGFAARDAMDADLPVGESDNDSDGGVSDVSTTVGLIEPMRAMGIGGAGGRRPFEMPLALQERLEEIYEYVLPLERALRGIYVNVADGSSELRDAIRSLLANVVFKYGFGGFADSFDYADGIIRSLTRLRAMMEIPRFIEPVEAAIRRAVRLRRFLENKLRLMGFWDE